MSGGWIAEIGEGCWIAPWDGDPGRTAVEQNAVRYKTESAANSALKRIRKKFPFRKIQGRAVWSNEDRSKTLVTIPPLSEIAKNAI